MHILVRFFKINILLWGWIIWFGLKRAKIIRSSMSPSKKLALTFESLGATFVKLGQGLSLHRELLPEDYVDSLERLQDQVGECEFSFIVNEIERSFKRPLSGLFQHFEPIPLGGGSIAQVHRAVLFDGRDVIVKVRRPGIKRQVHEDVKILRWVAKSVLLFSPALKKIKPLEIIEELSKNLNKEIDFKQEASNISRFVEMFKDWPTVYIPAVVDDLYTEWVIIQEMSHGHKIDEPEFRSKGHQLAETLVDSFLHQCLVIGTFHGDPHPGNLFVLSDGRICLHDFGLIGFLDKSSRLSLVGVMEAFFYEDSEWLLDSCIELGILESHLNRPDFIRSLEELIDDYGRLPLKDWSLSTALLRIASMGDKKNARLPHHIVTFIRSMFLMESAIRKLDPNFNLSEGLFSKAQKMAASLTRQTHSRSDFPRVKFESAKALNDLPATLTRAFLHIQNEGLEFSLQHRGLNEVIKETQQSSRRLSMSVIALGLYIASAILVSQIRGVNSTLVYILIIVGFLSAIGITLRVAK